jgi:predicted nucleic acid-binding protein
MNADVLFFDTNVLVYLFDEDEPRKQAIARALLRDSTDIRLSTQVLAEFYVTVTRKLARPLKPETAYQAVEELRAFPVAVPTDTARHPSGHPPQHRCAHLLLGRPHRRDGTGGRRQLSCVGGSAGRVAD